MLLYLCIILFSRKKERVSDTKEIVNITVSMNRNVNKCKKTIDKQILLLYTVQKDSRYFGILSKNDSSMHFFTENKAI